MKKKNAGTDTPLYQPESSSLRTELQLISEKCINCDLCQKECAFLRQYGKPKEIADSYDPNSKSEQSIAFECSLCQLCQAVCPVDINPANMFLEMRREAVRQGNGNYPEHGRILGYERRGTSKKYTYYGLPEGCNTILFPGCNLPGTRPDKTKKLFEYLRQHIPSLGIVMDCCTKPSHDLGREAYFGSMFGEMRTFLINNGIKKVFVACPNCYTTFKSYGGDLTVQTVYEFISGNGLPIKTNINNTATIHDPCSLRFEEPIQSAIRNIVTRQGIAINEMVHSGNKTLCCGEGGSVGFISPEVSNKWSDIRKAEANGNRTVTYCGGCTDQLGKKIPTTHILDLLFEPQAALSGKVKVSKTPMTYFNRLRIKNFFKKAINSAVSRERTFSPNEDSRKGRAVVHAFFVLLIIAAIISVHLTGAEQYLEQEGLRQLDQEYGTLAGTTAFAETQKHPEIKIIKGAANNHMRVDTANRELRISATVTKDVTKPSVVDWGRRCQAFFGVKGGKMEEFFVFTTDVSRIDINNAILELGIKSRRQIPFEEVAARQGLKPTTTEDDYLNGDPVIVTICFEKNGEIVQSAMEDMIQEKILVEDKEVIKPYTPHFIYHGTGEALNFPSGCIVCPSDCNGGIITDNARPLKTEISYYKVNWDRMPPVGSKVEVAIKSIYGSSRLSSTKP